MVTMVDDTVAAGLKRRLCVDRGEAKPQTAQGRSKPRGQDRPRVARLSLCSKAQAPALQVQQGAQDGRWPAVEAVA